MLDHSLCSFIDNMLIFHFVQEPVRDEDDIVKFCEETGLPVALDETIDGIHGNPLKTLDKFSHTGIVAIVSKHRFQ